METKRYRRFGWGTVVAAVIIVLAATLMVSRVGASGRNVISTGADAEQEIDVATQLDDLIGSPIPIVGEFGINYSSAVAWDSQADRYLATWGTLLGDHNDTEAQLITGSGSLIGTRIVVMGGNYEGGATSAVYNPVANEYLVLWTNVHYVLAQRMSWSGSLLGSRIIVTTGPFADRPAVAVNVISNEYFVVWTAGNPPGTNSRVYGRRISGLGALLSDQIPISGSEIEQRFPDVAWNAATNEYLVVWADQRQSLNQILGQRLAADGKLLGGQIFAGQAFGNTSGVSITRNAADREYMVVWGEQSVASGYDILAARVSDAGVPLGQSFPVYGTAGDQYKPDVAWNSLANQYLVGWTDNNSKISARRLTGTGQLMGIMDGKNWTLERPGLRYNTGHAQALH